MNELKLMIVEDADSDLEVCRTSVDIYQAQKKNDGIDLSINLIECKTVDEALQIVDNSFDGAIIDLKFPSGDDKGKEVWTKIRESFFRIPVIIHTGTPDSIDEDDRLFLVSVLKKGEADYKTEILDSFYDIYNTGMTRIIGGRGKIEETLNEVFLKNLLPQLEIWKNYGKSDTQRTEKALLRFTLNHLIQLLDDDEDQFFAEEVYIYPPHSSALRTGSILPHKTNGSHRIVLNPACDLVVRTGNQINTDRILLADIESTDKAYRFRFNKIDQDQELDDVTKREHKKQTLFNIFNNKNALYQHYLPKVGFFSGGIINFRKLSTFSKKDLKKEYDSPSIQVSPAFTKDILSRFSSYYARQGQPDLDCSQIIGDILDN